MIAKNFTTGYLANQNEKGSFIDLSHIGSRCIGMYTGNLIFGKPGKGTKTFPSYTASILYDLFSHQWMVSLEK